MLRDPVRLKALLTDERRPDPDRHRRQGPSSRRRRQSLIQEMAQFADDPAVRERIVFLPDYDMAMAKAYPGCDVG